MRNLKSCHNIGQERFKAFQENSDLPPVLANLAEIGSVTASKKAFFRKIGVDGLVCKAMKKNNQVVFHPDDEQDVDGLFNKIIGTLMLPDLHALQLYFLNPAIHSLRWSSNVIFRGNNPLLMQDPFLF